MATRNTGSVFTRVLKGSLEMNRYKNTRILAESAVLTAAALALSYIKIPIGFTLGGFGGSIDFVMIPLIIIALRHGAGWGLGAGLVFGTLKYFFAAGFAFNWQSIILDYAVAYMAVGLAGLPRVRRNAVAGTLVGVAGRFIIHFISGITIYAQWMPEEFLNMTMTNTWVYSLLYNGTYMLPNAILAVIIVPVLTAILRKQNI